MKFRRNFRKYGNFSQNLPEIFITFHNSFVFVSKQQSYRGCMRQLAPQPVFASRFRFAPLGAFTTNVLAEHTPVLLRSGCILDRELSSLIMRHIGKRFDSDLLRPRPHRLHYVTQAMRLTVACVESPPIYVCVAGALLSSPADFSVLRVPNFYRLLGPASSDFWSRVCLPRVN